MKTTRGLWIDHRKAVIVTVTGNGEEVKEIISHDKMTVPQLAAKVRKFVQTIFARPGMKWKGG